jgi:hypothetical protein
MRRRLMVFAAVFGLSPTGGAYTAEPRRDALPIPDPAFTQLKALQAAFDVEAKKYGVLPLDDRFAERAVEIQVSRYNKGKRT